MPTNGKRVAYGRNQNRVSLSTYPDDTSVPVRTSHWNQDPHDQAILGFTKITATLDASGVIYTKDDSATYGEDDGSTYSRQSTLIEVECTGSTTTDAIAKIDVTDTNENDILYLFKGTAGDTITIASATPSVAGHIKTQLSGGATLVHDGVPIMLIRRGDYWYEFGADGAASTPYAAPTIGSTSIASGSTNATIAGLTLTTPNIGTPSAGTLTSCTGLPAAGVTGTAAILGANTFTADQTVPATNKFIFGTNTYVYEPTTATPAIVAGNTTKMAWGTLGTSIPATQRFYLDGSTPTGNTYFHESSADVIQFVAGGTAILDVDSGGIDVKGNNIDSVKNIDHDVSAITHSASNTVLNFALDQVQYLSVNANTTFTTSNILAGKSKTIKIIADGTDRVLTFPAAFRWVGTAPTSNTHTITASKLAVLTMTCFADASDANVLCAFALEE